ncbi:hypothetical protein L9F63_011217, partial [Diploptera punctata]
CICAYPFLVHPSSSTSLVACADVVSIRDTERSHPFWVCLELRRLSPKLSVSSSFLQDYPAKIMKQLRSLIDTQSILGPL